MKKLIILIIGLLASVITYSAHLKGGWIFYEAIGPGTASNTIKYRITVKQYLDCTSNENGQVDAQVYVGIFSNSTNGLVTKLTILKSNTEFIQKQSFSPCITPVPYICYRIDSYVQEVDLAETASGYTLSVQRCCRVRNIVNVTNSDQIGVSYTTSIPGVINGLNAANNNSPVFAQKDTAVVCYSTSFTFDFGATDNDNDSLVYSFCDGLVGGGTNNNAAQPDPPSNPPYASVPYNPGYSGVSPMGPTVTINPKTGLITGVAPSTIGDYVVAVCATEFRNGIKIGETKKEIHVNVANCRLSAAELKPAYITCNGFDIFFENQSTSPLISSYTWQFGDPASGLKDTSNSPTPIHTYTDTGVYLMKLKVESNGGCKDSTTSLVRVFPGFIADFNIAGSCFETPFIFTDKTFTRYGVVDSWKWDLGNPDVNDDTSSLKNVTYKYPGPGQRTAQLIVTNSKGCADTLSKPVNVLDKPLLNLPFHDTLICSIDTLQLRAEGTGVFSWIPAALMINPNSPNPLVYPKDTATYVVTLNDNGCMTKDSITINVLDFITVEVGNDTSICRTDSIIMQTKSYGLQYQWTPTIGLNDPNIKFPVARPLSSTKYYVTAHLGKCLADDSIFVKVAPYPQSNAGNDASICYGTRTQLNASIVGSSFKWTPINSLLNPTTLNPVAGPAKTTAYLLTVYDTIGCPKPFTDTVNVTVIPPVKAFAGNDTNIVANQPLQLKATGGSTYAWSPSFGLNSTNVPDPVATLNASVESIIYTVRVTIPEGCFATDDIKVTVFKTGPEIFVPSGFTPNADEKNDILKPILVGMKGLTYFRIYNRWGQMLYSTSEVGKGWNGTFGGKEQQTGTYVYAAEAMDYNGHKVNRKGTVVLIR